MARTAKPKVRKTIRHNESAPDVIQATQIALVLIAAAKGTTWADVIADEDLHSRVELTPEQQAVLERNAAILPYLGRGGGERTARSTIACPECNRFMFTAGAGTAPTRCLMTTGCPGKPMKARSNQEPLAKQAEAA